MRSFSNVIRIVGVVAALVPAPVSAQSPGTGAHLHVNDFFDQHPQLTKDEFKEFAAQLGSVLRFQQLGDATTLGKGRVEVAVQFANTPISGPPAAWNGPTMDQYLARSISFPQVVARFGVSDSVDIGVRGGFDGYAKYGLAGVDTKIALLKQGPAWPVSVSIRPSATFLVGASSLWGGTAGVDLTVSRAFGLMSPYAGLAASSSGAIARPKNVALEAVSAGEALAYAGLSCQWRALVFSSEVDKGNETSYAFRIGTRF